MNERDRHLGRGYILFIILATVVMALQDIFLFHDYARAITMIGLGFLAFGLRPAIRFLRREGENGER